MIRHSRYADSSVAVTTRTSIGTGVNLATSSTVPFPTGKLENRHGHGHGDDENLGISAPVPCIAGNVHGLGVRELDQPSEHVFPSTDPPTYFFPEIGGGRC